jgi:nicotinamidase-related amidase
MAKPVPRFPLTANTLHLCIDMQRLFSADGPWTTPWMDRVLPVVLKLASRHPERTIFTRFMPPWQPSEMPGVWQRYYERWREVTRERIDPRLLDLLPALQKLTAPATVIDKTRYSAFAEPQLLQHLQDRKADGLIVTGSETDVCVLATVLGAVDHGYRVTLVTDGLCSFSDEGHDALMCVYKRRYTEQIETATAASILRRWR